MTENSAGITDSTQILLEQAIKDYLLWMIDTGYAAGTWSNYEHVLHIFLRFVIQKKIPWENIFTPQTLTNFKEKRNIRNDPSAVKSLARHLFNKGKIPQPIQKLRPQLPSIYEDYLLYYKRVRQVTFSRIGQSRKVLTALHHYLEKQKVELDALQIEHVDSFLAKYNKNYATASHSIHRSLMRGFLRYLYQERRIISRNLEPFIVGATLFAQQKPPRFLRPQEVQQLFTSITPSTPEEIRTYAMLHLAYALGLRPQEVSRISLDDISFSRSEITLPERKGSNPIKLPLPENTIKAIAVYLVGARPQTKERSLFVSHIAPHGPLTRGAVSLTMRAWFHKAGLINASAYWLRHTYAQNLLEADASIFEIKEMMGHDVIQTTERYLNIHINLMKKVLFDETI